MRGSAVKPKHRCGHRWQRGRTGQGGWRGATRGRPRRTRPFGWVGSRCGAMRDDPLQRKRQRVPRRRAVRSGRPEAPVCPRHRQACLPSAQAERWVRIFPVCRLPVRFRTQTGARHRQVDHPGLPVCRVGTGRLDEGEDAHSSPAARAQEGIRLIDLLDQPRPLLLACSACHGQGDLDHLLWRCAGGLSEGFSTTENLSCAG
jgi:hypothetical protein